MILTIRVKGGEGSGNFGHSGRPGLVGGSEPGKMHGEVDALADLHWDSGFGSGYFLTGDGRILDIGRSTHVDYLLENPDSAKKIGVKTSDLNKIDNYVAEDDLSTAWAVFQKVMRYTGLMRIRDMGRITAINTGKMDNVTLRKIQRMYDAGKVSVSSPYSQISWEADGKQLNANLQDLLSAKYVVPVDDWNMTLKEIIIEKGGKGSGNFDHAGRPGLVGGSTTGTRLADAIPVRKYDADRIMQIHPNWTREQAESYIAHLPLPDTSKIVIEKERGGKHHPDSYFRHVYNGRDAIKAVHKELTGVDVLYRSQAEVQNLGLTAKVRGVYDGRRIFLTPAANDETYVHEYGHYIDNLMGVRQGDSWWSYKESLLADITNPKDQWMKREMFAEFYSSWIYSKGKVKSTLSRLIRTQGWKDTDLDIVEKWDSTLRSELDMNL